MKLLGTFVYTDIMDVGLQPGSILTLGVAGVAARIPVYVLTRPDPGQASCASFLVSDPPGRVCLRPLLQQVTLRLHSWKVAASSPVGSQPACGHLSPVGQVRSQWRVVS